MDEQEYYALNKMLIDRIYDEQKPTFSWTQPEDVGLGVQALCGYLKMLTINGDDMNEIDDELKDLLKIYKETTEHLDRKQHRALLAMVEMMRAFLCVYDDNKKVRNKLEILEHKLSDEEE